MRKKSLQKKEQCSIWVWSDLHLFHKLMAKVRGFDSVGDMNAFLISFAKKVPVNHTLYILGDLSLGKLEETTNLVKQIKCRKILVKGNHDYFKITEYQKMGFESVLDYAEIKWNKMFFCLSHYPFLKWNRMQYGSFHFFGHSHGKLEHRKNSIDVGVESFYRPLRLDEFVSLIEKLNMEHRQ